ncbi:MAG: glycosyltransferase family 4 protein [Phycisphaerales bacterium]
MSDRPLTILQTLPALAGGGVERGTLEVSDEIVRRGWRSIVVSAGGRMVADLEAGGATHIAMPIGAKGPRALGCIKRLQRILRDERVDVLHARSRMPAWVSVLALRRMREAGRPALVTTVHGLHSVSRYSAVMTRGEVVIAVSESVRAYIKREYPATDMSRVVVIPRGVDPGAFPRGYQPTEAWREAFFGQHPALEGRPIATIVGRLTRLKGHLDFLDAIAHARTLGVNVAGLVVGDEDPRRKAYAGEVRTRAAAVGGVVFAGHRSDVREIDAISDVVVSLSTKPESFGRAALEALAMGTPVVGYDHGGVGEVLAEMLPAGRVALGDARAAGERIASFVHERPEVRAHDRFTLRAMLDKTMAVYAQLGSVRR